MKITLEPQTSKIVLDLTKGLSIPIPILILKAIGLYYLFFKKGIMTKDSGKKLYIYNTNTGETEEVSNI